MAAHAERPIIFPLVQSRARAEATPADLIAWTDGRALIATGSSFTPVTYKGVTYVIGQANNAMLYPGLGSRRDRVAGPPDQRWHVRGRGRTPLSSLVAVRLPGASLLPHVDDLRSVARDGGSRRGGGGGGGGLGRRQTRRHRSRGERRHVAAGVSPDRGGLK